MISPTQIKKPRWRAFELVFLACGVWLIGLGLYFAFLRPALLPEDLRYIGSTLRDIQSVAPGVEHWLHWVFSVMGGFMIGAGILLIHVMTSMSTLRSKRAWIMLGLAGLSTVGFMSAANFQLDSDFKWLLVVPTLGWAAGLALHWRLAIVSQHRQDASRA
jgi:hypothetical protein